MLLLLFLREVVGRTLEGTSDMDDRRSQNGLLLCFAGLQSRCLRRLYNETMSCIDMQSGGKSSETGQRSSYPRRLHMQPSMQAMLSANSLRAREGKTAGLEATIGANNNDERSQYKQASKQADSRSI